MLQIAFRTSVYLQNLHAFEKGSKCNLQHLCRPIFLSVAKLLHFVAIYRISLPLTCTEPLNLYYQLYTIHARLDEKFENQTKNGIELSQQEALTPRVRAELESKNVETLNEALRLARVYNKGLGNIASPLIVNYARQRTEKWYPKTGNSPRYKNGYDNGDNANHQAETRDKGLICFRCKKPGHRIAQCRVKSSYGKINGKTTKRANLVEECKRSDSDSESKTEYVYTFDSGRLLYVSGYVNEHRIKFVVDSGCTTSVISSRFVKKTVDGKTESLRVDIEGNVCELDFLVIDHEDNDGLLGLDWFMRTGASLIPSLRCINFPMVLNPDKSVKAKLGRALDNVLEKKPSALVYLNDIIIHSGTLIEHIEQVVDLATYTEIFERGTFGKVNHVHEFFSKRSFGKIFLRDRASLFRAVLVKTGIRFVFVRKEDFNLAFHTQTEDKLIEDLMWYLSRHYVHKQYDLARRVPFNILIDIWRIHSSLFNSELLCIRIDSLEKLCSIGIDCHNIMKLRYLFEEGYVKAIKQKQVAVKILDTEIE
ncbi:unnamed protein product [Brachionus calyciflorus]|uniref:CCHC-type domain-containing protein n=1 Tax=Brachionus calyciflorus TaxID=104777 RepID=A0A814FI14_9BILA|nr:unnamed protein product [Brachionus calyciflorus]